MGSKVIKQTLFGDIRVATHRPTKTLRAVKKFSKQLVRRQRTKDGRYVREDMELEMQLMTKLRETAHAGLIAASAPDEQVEDRSHRYIVMPFAPRGDLLGYIEERKGN